ncbi:uncharacterized protein MELLADRAFT_90968 [Melampsora larici-populina 98AG31]|uniref:Uncharacterized protein n=1 Tax=Melampsora larici-populina (strain 98AG31 / pathotype 3-4-7) TaxID=747676 RepID=F4R875_MELLP|nr:uncharacterized protein MELLADRAFT_90968 [Melampsora larici-populina 98AG31]EGG11663.1 hypothetical protein MELLADRAFT_90968 [Melampsora larici-populina 98AG31]
MTNQKQSRYATRSSTQGLYRGSRKVRKTSSRATASNHQTSEKIHPEDEKPMIKTEASVVSSRGDGEEDETPTPSYRAISAGSEKRTPDQIPNRSVLEVFPLEFHVDGGNVIFPALRMIMDATTLKDYLEFARVEPDEIARVIPILKEKGVNHFDLFLFKEYVNKDIMKSWGISPGTAARMMVYAHMFYQSQVELDGQYVGPSAQIQRHDLRQVFERPEILSKTCEIIDKVILIQPQFHSVQTSSRKNIMGYPIAPVKIEQPFISPKLIEAIDNAHDAGQDLRSVDDLLRLLDLGTMRLYATMTTRLKKDGSNYNEWVDTLNENVWFKAGMTRDYLDQPRPEFNTLFDWVLDEILLAIICATVHRDVVEALRIASDPHDALMWLNWYYNCDWYSFAIRGIVEQ